MSEYLRLRADELSDMIGRIEHTQNPWTCAYRALDGEQAIADRAVLAGEVMTLWYEWGTNDGAVPAQLPRVYHDTPFGQVAHPPMFTRHCHVCRAERSHPVPPVHDLSTPAIRHATPTGTLTHSRLYRERCELCQADDARASADVAMNVTDDQARLDELELEVADLRAENDRLRPQLNVWENLAAAYRQQFRSAGLLGGEGESVPLAGPLHRAAWQAQTALLRYAMAILPDGTETSGVRPADIYAPDDAGFVSVPEVPADWADQSIRVTIHAADEVPAPMEEMPTYRPVGEVEQ